MKISDINLLTVVGLTVICALFGLITGDVPYFVCFWWVLLLPGAYILAFRKNTKLGKWYLSKVSFKKR